MFKKKETKDSTLKLSGKVTKNQAGNLALLIAQMQKNADQVEKDILHSEELLAVDAENEKKDQPLLHEKEVSDKLGNAEGLLKDLFLDVDKAKKLKHPQAREIESDVIHLHDRWLKDCVFYRDIYEQIDDVSLMPRIDWGPIFNQKQKEVNVEDYGPTMADLEKQIAAHNLTHKEIEAYNSQLCVSSAGSKEQYTVLKKQYNNLLDNSKWRRHYLNSLYEYMQGNNKEMAFLGEEQEKIKRQDWSDRMVDPPDVRRQYENFKNNSLLSHESEVNKLQEEGDRLTEMKHPASATIQAQRDVVRNEWQKFLNLCICQETHLDNVEEFKRYQMETDQLSDTLTKLNNSLDPKSISRKSNSETLLQLEAEERAVQNSEQLLADLRRRSTTIAPLKLRRNNPNRPITVESLCDWETDKAALVRGEKLTLKSNSDIENWDVISADGKTKTFPGVCFQIPPPDPEAIDKVDLLGGELADIKKRRAALVASLKNHKSISRPQQSAPVSSPSLDPKVTALAQQLDKLDDDLASAEESMLSRLRAPLSRTDPAADLVNRLREQEKAAEALKALEQQKLAAQADLQPLLASNTSSALPLKLSDANNKHDSIAALADLYNKKANASLNLERQINKVDGLVSGFEKKLSEDGPILDEPHAIQARTEDIQCQQRSVAAAQDDMKKMSQDLETTEQLCSSLQQGYQEYCPDIQRQRTEVKQLQTRYANVANQLKERENLSQEAATKNQEFQSTQNSLNSFLDNLPTNVINSNDDLSQVSAKQSSQERVMDDLKRKGDDMDRFSDVSLDLQNLLNEYETNVDKYNSTLEDAGATVAKKPHMLTLADAVQKEEKDLVNRFAEATAENTQRQKQMDLAKNLILQNEEKVQMVSQQQVQLQSQQSDSFEFNNLLKELEEEKERTVYTESELRTFKDRMLSLKSRRGVERVEEKEVLQYYRDPKLERDLADLQRSLHDETLRRSTTQTEVEVFNKKITILEDTLKNTPPKLVTREVTEFERDPQLDVDAAKLRDEIGRMRDEIRARDGEHIQMKTEVTILEQKRPPIKERVVKREVVKVEQDPQMLRSVRTFETEISDENNKSKLLNDEIFQTRSQINALERLIPNIKPKIITKEVKKVEQDPDLISESKKIQTNIEEERIENSSLSHELMELHRRYREVQNWKPKVEVKEIVNEIYWIDPNTEVEIMRLRKDIQDSGKQRTDLERNVTQVTSELNILRSEKPKVELKEVLQEVVKEERSPENEREIQRLNDQVNHLHTTCNSLLDKVSVLRKERDEWKAEKSKIETRLVTREVIKYEPDPLLEKEADRLRRDVREEAQLRRSIEEMVFDLQNKYILLERQKPEEKVVVQEVVRLQKDPRQLVEHEKLSRSLDEELMNRRQIELELQQLRTTVEDKERILRESVERQKRIQAESEVREIQLRITQLENAPPPVEESIIVEEVLKVERDPKLERMTNGLRSDMDQQTSDILRLQREIRSVTLKLEFLQKEKSSEKTVYKEVVRVEKDQAVEAERDRLREQLSQHKFTRQDLEDEIRRINDKINLMKSSKSSSSREENTLIINRDALQREKDNLTRELRTLEAKKHDTSLSFQQQSRLISERTQKSKQRSLKMESDTQRLEREILDEKDKIHMRDSTIRDLLLQVQKEEQNETRTKETNVSTKITILDPDTGKDMSPYDAYLQGLIDRQQYIHLQELECDWEEITSMGPDGETSVLQDRKSGKQYSIKDALKEGRLTEYNLQQYKQGKMAISEFALLVAGDNRKQPQYNSVTQNTITPVKSAPPASTKEEILPVAGVIDTNTDTCFTIRSATLRKLIDPTTAQKLLEAQAATGGIIDITNKERYTVHKAATRGLIEDSQLQRLLNAQKAFSGVEEPMTRECLSVGEAIQKGWMRKDTAIRYMEAQYLTGGLVNPKTGSRVSIFDALGTKMIDSTMMRELQAESSYIKDIVDPITKERINYKQALDRCKKQPVSGLPMLPASSKDSGYTYNSTSKYTRF
ncbi:Envoplakin 210 kDa cornified envelope precursor protein [Collichthys lucidus]|uniref:Envoplakin 210 kDa cornified envelope protein n=1 Tax=Collichthys lucidus TaxID=240159 RepID=A0A4U5U3S5_COLLU|nr:Envoplakin 210 kDa cornified envelope precursor protein [Collichthys lucidus]